MIRVVTCYLTGSEAEMVSALLMEAGFEGIEEQVDAVKAYVTIEAADQLDLEGHIAALAAQFGFTYEWETLEEENWNARWEADFQPVAIEGRCQVRASFHPAQPEWPHDIVINPKMSFGTGHHATTYQMIQRMLELEWSGKRILDFGSGTAVLAILAEQLGAAEVDAIDNDAWAFENAKENLNLNHAQHIRPLMGTLSDLVQESPYDAVLANINRQVLLDSAQDLRQLLAPGGLLLMSGLLDTDKERVLELYRNNGFSLVWEGQQEQWLCLQFE
mgnify:CR=1 FL=1